MANKKNASAWLLAPNDVGLNQDTNLLKLVAMVTMLIDHTGKMFFSNQNVMRLIGRTAFPIYAYCLAAGCVYSKDRLKYLTRIVLLGLISQPFYAVAMGHATKAMYEIPFRTRPLSAIVHFYVESFAHPSIMLTLALGLLVIWTLREKRIALTLALALLVWKIKGSIDYGWKGIVLIALFYITIRHWWVSLPVVAAFMIWWALGTGTYHLFGRSFSSQMFAILALPLIYIHTRSNLKISKWVFYLYYPAHLIGMLLIEMALGMV